MNNNTPPRVDELYGVLELSSDGRKWLVAHTKPQSEKKLAEFAYQNAIHYYLPMYTAEHSYKHKKVAFYKPLFRGYIFLHGNPEDKTELLRSGYVVHFLNVVDEAELISELQAIRIGTSRSDKFETASWLEKGLPVEITGGALKGMHGVVESYERSGEVRLQVDILRQAIMVKVPVRYVRIPDAFRMGTKTQ